MGGAQVADSSDYSSLYYNPSSMVLSGGGNLTFGAGIGLPTLKVNGNEMNAASVPGVNMGVIAQLGGILDDAYAGLYVYMPTNSATTIISRAPSEPQFLRYQGLHRYTIYSGLAYRIHPIISVGVGLSFLTSAEGTLEFTVDLANQSIPDRDYYLKMRPTAAGVIGGIITPIKGLRLGISYRGEHKMDIDMPSSFDVGVFALTSNYVSAAFYSPGQIQSGVCVNFYEPLKVNLDMVYSFWSRAPELSPYVEINTNALFPYLPGVAYKPGLKNTASLRFGSEYTVFDWLMPRLGFAFEPTPFPDQTGGSNYLDNTRAVLTSGLGVNWFNPIWEPAKRTRFDVAFQYHFFLSRKAEKTNPLDKIGDLEYTGKMVYLGLNWTTEF